MNYTGEEYSNTLLFEKIRRWTGLLIEADPDRYAILKTKNRNAYTINACLNTKPYPAKMTFNLYEHQMGRMVHKDSLEWLQKNKLPEHEIQVQCVPLYSLLLALNQTKIDLLSLDIEGDELFVLQSIPFEKVDIRTIIVEYSHVPGGEERVESYLMGKGYRTLKKISLDLVFIKK